MTTKEAIDHYGSISKLAKALNIHAQGIYRWKECPPKLRQYQIEVLTKRKLKAEK